MRSIEPLVEAVRAVCPGFEPIRGMGRTSKARLVAGAVAGRAAVAKILAQPTPTWRWVHAREIAVYEAFERAPPPVRVPRVLAADADRGVLVLELVPGRRLSGQRRATRPLAGALEPLSEALAALAGWDADGGFARCALPPAACADDVRARMLPDPSRDWIPAGAATCARRGLLTDADAEAIARALADHPWLCPSHGDLLLRNVLVTDTGVALVDWEAAGRHPPAWDAALVWAGLTAPDRSRFERLTRAAPSEWRTLFDALRLFAVARELYLRRYRLRAPPGHPAVRALERDRDALSAAAGFASAPPRM